MGGGELTKERVQWGAKRERRRQSGRSFRGAMLFHSFLEGGDVCVGGGVYDTLVMNKSCFSQLLHLPPSSSSPFFFCCFASFTFHLPAASVAHTHIHGHTLTLFHGDNTVYVVGQVGSAVVGERCRMSVVT